MNPSERTRRRLLQLGAVLLLAAGVVVFALVSSGGDSKSPTRAQPRAQLAGIPQDGITLGDPRAKVTLVEFADLQCPYCREFAQQTLPRLVDAYVRTGKVKLEFRSLAFIGEDSVRAAGAAARAAREDKLWNFVDAFYANQGAENSGYVTDDFLRSLGAPAGGSGGEEAIAAANTLARRYGVDSTPTLVVGGKKVDGFDYDTVKRAIDVALAA